MQVLIDLSAIAIGAAGLLTFLAAFKLGRVFEHKANLRNGVSVPELQEALERAKGYIANRDSQLEYYVESSDKERSYRSVLTAERDKFKELAQSHTVTWVDPPKSKIETEKLWNKRPVTCVPPQLLDILAKDLPLEEPTLVLYIKITNDTRLRSIESKSGDYDFCVEGTRERILSSIEAILWDPKYPWGRLVASQTIQVEMTLNVERRIVPVKPLIHEVLIPVVETKVIEIVKEKVVEKPVADPDVLAALIEVAIDEKLTQRANARIPTHAR